MKYEYPKIQPIFRISINQHKDIHKSNYEYPIIILLKDIFKSNNGYSLN